VGVEKGPKHAVFGCTSPVQRSLLIQVCLSVCAGMRGHATVTTAKMMTMHNDRTHVMGA
jgi:hypothetical protein